MTDKPYGGKIKLTMTGSDNEKYEPELYNVNVYGKAALLIWDFGDYNGTINFEGTHSGRLAASNATLKLNELCS